MTQLESLRAPLQSEQVESPVLRVQSLTKSWPRVSGPVLRDVELVLPAGRLAWLRGENGAGKTTLLRVIAGIIAPDRGTVHVGGRTLAEGRRAFQGQIGLLTAGNSGLYARLTTRQQLDYWARLALIASEQRRERVDGTIERFALGNLAARRLDRMSMGQRQRVRIALAFLHRPKLLLLDEPATSLDGEGRELLVAAVERHQQEAGATLWCSPTGEELGMAAAQTLLLAGGELHRDA